MGVSETLYTEALLDLTKARNERERARATAVALEQQLAQVAELHGPHYWRVGRGPVDDVLVAGISDGSKGTTHTICRLCGGMWPCQTSEAIDPEADQ